MRPQGLVTNEQYRSLFRLISVRRLYLDNMWYSRIEKTVRFKTPHILCDSPIPDCIPVVFRIPLQYAISLQVGDPLFHQHPMRYQLASLFFSGQFKFPQEAEFSKVNGHIKTTPPPPLLGLWVWGNLWRTVLTKFCTFTQMSMLIKFPFVTPNQETSWPFTCLKHPQEGAKTRSFVHEKDT